MAPSSIILAQYALAAANTAGATNYTTISGIALNGQNTESIFRTKWRSTGLLSRLWTRISANTLTASSTMTLRVNSAAGNQTLSIGSSTSGEFEDLVGSDYVKSGDNLGLQYVWGATGTSIFNVGSRIVYRSGESRLLGCGYGSGLVTGNTASVTNYSPLGGYTGSSTTESNAAQTALCRVQIANLFLCITQNSRPGMTYSYRKNGATGSFVISPVGSGLFEDLTKQDTLDPGDTFNLMRTYGSGSNTCTDSVFGATMWQIGSDQHLTLSAAAGHNITAASITRFLTVSGQMGSTATEADTQVTLGRSSVLRMLNLRVTVNARTSTTFTVRKNGADTDLTFSVADSTTGLFSDARDSVVALGPDDDVNYQYVSGTGLGTLTMVFLTSVLSNPADRAVGPRQLRRG